LTIAEDKVVYKLGPEVTLTEAGTEEYSEDPVAPKPPLPDPIPAPSSPFSCSEDKESCRPTTSR
jgi:hypothetical protein